MRASQIDRRWYGFKVGRRVENNGRLKVIMRLMEDEGAQSHRAEDSAVTSPNNRLSRTYPSLGDGEARQMRVIIG